MGKSVSIAECYAALGLPASATAEDIRRRFRRLVREHHPDVNPGRRDHSRFVRIAAAYRTLRESLRNRAADSTWAPCPRCGQYADLLEGLDGRQACLDCLLGITQRRRFLPMPIIVAARHLTVIGLYVAAVAFLLAYMESNAPNQAWLAVCCASAGFVILALQVIYLTRGASERAPRRYAVHVRPARSGSAQSRITSRASVTDVPEAGE